MTCPDVTAPCENPFVTIDGLALHLGEDCADYHARALAWMASNPGFDPAEHRHSLHRLLAASASYAACISIVIGMCVLA
jgi:hypothetical protein